MPRADLSDQVIHFTQGPTAEAAYQRLGEILVDGRLRGSDRLILNHYRCVCFTEAPLVALTDGLVNGRYAPFGLRRRGSWATGFARRCRSGARKVEPCWRHWIGWSAASSAN